jgi:hypothetical protein
VFAEENKALVRREQQELWNHTGNLDAAEQLFAAEQAEAARQEAPARSLYSLGPASRK